MIVYVEGEFFGVDDYVKLFYFLINDFYEKVVCCELVKDEFDYY